MRSINLGLAAPGPAPHPGIGKEKPAVHWIVDTWEVTPSSAKLFEEDSRFPEEQQALFASDPDRYKHVWFSGWLIWPANEHLSPGFEPAFDRMAAGGKAQGVYVADSPFAPYLGTDDHSEYVQYGNNHWARISILAVVDQRKISVEKAVKQMFTAVNPRLRVYDSNAGDEGGKEVIPVSPDASLLQRRDVPEDYFDHVKAEILRVYPATEDMKYKIVFDRGYYAEHRYNKNESPWFVDFRLSNDKYRMPIRCVYNFFGDEDGANNLVRTDKCWFFADYIQTSLNENGVFTGWLHFREEYATAEDVMKHLLEEEFSCRISFEPDYGGEDGVGGPWYPYVYRYEEIREYPNYPG